MEDVGGADEKNAARQDPGISGPDGAAAAAVAAALPSMRGEGGPAGSGACWGPWAHHRHCGQFVQLLASRGLPKACRLLSYLGAFERCVLCPSAKASKDVAAWRIPGMPQQHSPLGIS